MRGQALWPFVLGLALIVVLFDSTFYTVRQGQRAVVTSFGRIIASRIGPGLHAKIPFADDVHVFNARLLSLRVEPQVILTKGQKHLLVEAFLEWRIQSFRRYMTSTGGVRHKADERLRQVATSALRQAFGSRDLKAIMRGDTSAALTQSVQRQGLRYGLQVVDLRVQRIGLASHVSAAIEKRMETEQMQHASKLEASGMANAQTIRARANRKRAELLAHAYEKAQIIRSQGDTLAGRIYTGAYGRDPHFFAFYRSLRAYVKSFANRHTILVLGPNSGFLRFLPGNGSRR